MDKLACIPLDALSVTAEDASHHTPRPGENVIFTAEGPLERIEGQYAYVKIRTVNGKDMPMDDLDEGQRLQYQIETMRG